MNIKQVLDDAVVLAQFDANQPQLRFACLTDRYAELHTVEDYTSVDLVLMRNQPKFMVLTENSTTHVGEFHIAYLPVFLTSFQQFGLNQALSACTAASQHFDEMLAA